MRSFTSESMSVLFSGYEPWARAAAARSSATATTNRID